MSTKPPVIPSIRSFHDVESALNNFRSYLVQVGIILDKAAADDLYAPSGSGVTNGNSHDHVGGDGRQIDHTTLGNLTTGDPHTQYQKESEKGVANGYAGLDASAMIPDAQIPAAITRDAEAAAAYAPIAKGVTGGDAHDHVGGYGAQVDHVNLSNIGTNTHAQIDTHLGLVHAPSDAQKNSDITKAEIEAKLTGVITSHSH